MSSVPGVNFSYSSDKLYDLNIIAGFARFLCLGLPPGGFEGACLTGDYDLAIQRASPFLRPRVPVKPHYSPGTAREDIVGNLIEFAQLNIPEVARGGPLSQLRWMKVGGLSGDPDARILYKLGHDVRWIKSILRTYGIDFDWETGHYKSIPLK